MIHISPEQLTSFINSGQGTVFDVGGPSIECLTPFEEQAYCVMRGTIPAGVSVPLHSHGDAESFYVLSGEAEVLTQTEGRLEWKTLGRGDFAHIPGDTKHAWRNLSERPFEALITTTTKLGRYLREMGQFVRAGGDGSLEELQRLSERYGYWTGSAYENAEVGISLP
jgi:quercetin dioxygenase-like cupin family protein